MVTYICTLDSFVSEWVANQALPMQTVHCSHLKKYQKILPNVSFPMIPLTLQKVVCAKNENWRKFNFLSHTPLVLFGRVYISSLSVPCLISSHERVMAFVYSYIYSMGSTSHLAKLKSQHLYTQFNFIPDRRRGKYSCPHHLADSSLRGKKSLWQEPLYSLLPCNRLFVFSM